MHEAFTVTSEVSRKHVRTVHAWEPRRRAPNTPGSYAEPNHGGRLSRSDRSFGHGIRVAPSTTRATMSPTKPVLDFESTSHSTKHWRQFVMLISSWTIG